MVRRTAMIVMVGFSVCWGSAANAQPPKDFTACEHAPQAAQLEPIRFATDRPRLADVDQHMVFGQDRPEFHGLVGFEEHPYATKHAITHGILDDRGEATASLVLTRQGLISQVVEAALPDDSDLVVYVHGYNTTFQGAARAALKLRLGLSCATNFKRKIVVLFFAWPSAARVLKPSDDEVRAEWAYRDFHAVMVALYSRLSERASPAGPKRAFAVAHSMGNRFLVHEIDDCPAAQKCFARVAFVAPDVDARLFADVLDSHPDAADRYSIYVSARDKVLWASQYFHGEGRAGEGGDELLRFTSDKIETIDAGYMQAETLCHSYIDRPIVLFDIAKAFFGPVVPDAPTRYAAQRPDAGNAHYLEIVENENSRTKAPCVGVPQRFQRY